MIPLETIRVLCVADYSVTSMRLNTAVHNEK